MQGDIFLRKTSRRKSGIIRFFFVILFRFNGASFVIRAANIVECDPKIIITLDLLTYKLRMIGEI